MLFLIQYLFVVCNYRWSKEDAGWRATKVVAHAVLGFSSCGGQGRGPIGRAAEEGEEHPEGQAGGEAACSSSPQDDEDNDEGGEDPDQDNDEGGREDDDQGCGAEAGQWSGASGSGVFGPQQRPYLRGPLSLLQYAIAQDRRPTICPLGAK